MQTKALCTSGSTDLTYKAIDPPIQANTNSTKTTAPTDTATPAACGNNITLHQFHYPHNILSLVKNPESRSSFRHLCPMVLGGHLCKIQASHGSSASQAIDNLSLLQIMTSLGGILEQSQL